MPIIIITGAIQKGKSTRLFMHYENRIDVGGLVCRESDQGRVFYDLASRNYIPFEMQAEAADTIAIGRFIFDLKAFDIGINILRESWQLNQTTILDEWGPLELNDKGFEPELREIISNAYTHHVKKLIIVVRDTLVDRFIDKYNLHMDALQIIAIDDSTELSLLEY